MKFNPEHISNNGPYAWIETRAEANLRQYLAESALASGSVENGRRIYSQTIEQAGLTVTLTERVAYEPDEDVEPLRFSVGLSDPDGQSGALLEVVVPSRHFEAGDFVALDEEEAIPPHVNLKFSGDRAPASLIATARDRLAAHPAAEGDAVWLEAKAGSCLDLIKGLFDTLPAYDSSVGLTPAAMEDVTALAQTWFDN